MRRTLVLALVLASCGGVGSAESLLEDSPLPSAGLCPQAEDCTDNLANGAVIVSPDGGTEPVTTNGREPAPTLPLPPPDLGGL